MELACGLEEMAALGCRLARDLRPGLVVHLVGDLGAGKTTLARAILHAAGHAGEVVSPSFTLVQPYDGPEMAPAILHVDLYRLQRPEELEEFGLEDALADAALLIEWPGQGGSRVPPADLVVTIFGSGDDGRRLTFSGPEGWEQRWRIA